VKKFLFALIVSLLVTATSHAEIQTFTGTDEYTVGETETQADAKERSRLRALRNAQEQAGVLIKSRSRMKDLELVDDEVVTIAAAVLKVVGAPDYKVRVLDDGKSTLIVTTVTVQIDTDDVDRRLKTIEARENPKPPVDKPKPIEQPAPQPVEQPKPEKVEPPTEKIEQPAEHGIKTFKGVGISSPQASTKSKAKEQSHRAAMADTYRQVAEFVANYFESHGCGIEKLSNRYKRKVIEFIKAIKFSDNIRYVNSDNVVTATVIAELNMDELDKLFKEVSGR